jgi:PIN domain nuclease of toxin-antitoxin system
MKNTVLDASALLVLFLDQSGAEKVEELFNRASESDKAVMISAVNWAEVLYLVERKQGAPGLETARQFEQNTPLETVPVDHELAGVAAHLKHQHGLGLADAFAAALALGKKAELVTGDLEFKALEKQLKIVWLK